MPLGIALIASAAALAASMASPKYAWLGWLALIPLFVAIRVCAPLGALLAGGFWGLCTCLLVSLWPSGNPVPPGATALSLGMGLLVLPLAGAGYCLTGALLTRWIGFSPFVLGVAWMGVELSLAPLGLDLGIVKLTDSSAPLVHWLAHTLGYVLVAFAVAFVNAQLAIVLSKVRLTVPQSVRIVRRAAVEPRLVAQQSAPFFLFDAVPCHPRAPPLRNCQLTRTVMCV